MSLEALLRKAHTAGGREIHLAAARKIRIVTPEGEREMQGPEITPQLLQQVQLLQGRLMQFQD